MRKRFNAVAICSSDNYEASRKAHYNMLQRNHEDNKEFFEEVQRRVVVTTPSKPKEVKIFGKWIPLSGKDPKSFEGFEMR